MAEHRGRPDGGRQQAEQDLDQRGLAGAVGADQAGDAVGQRDGEVIERDHGAVPLGQSAGADDIGRVNAGAWCRHADDCRGRTQSRASGSALNQP